VAPPAPRSLRHRQALTALGEVAQRLTAIALRDDRAERHAQDRVVPAAPVPVGAFAVMTALGRVVALVGKVQEGGDGGIRFQDDPPAVAAVAPVGPPAGHELLAPEAHAPGAS